jgi:hypothetical protein
LGWCGWCGRRKKYFFHNLKNLFPFKFIQHRPPSKQSYAGNETFFRKNGLKIATKSPFSVRFWDGVGGVDGEKIIFSIT